MIKNFRPRVMAKARPAALPVPHDRKVAAFTKPEVLTRWAKSGAELRAAQPAAASVIEMYDVIGEDFWSGGGVTLKKVEAQLKALRGQPVEVRINSGGGDMFEGFAIYNVLREHDAEVTVKVIGLAASAASIIAMAGDKVEIGAVSFLMIHNCWVGVVGNQFDLREVADWMAEFDLAMGAVYAERSGQTPDQIAEWLRAETWMSGATAIERGFADALLPSDTLVEDEPAAQAARDGAKIAAMEHALMAGGMTRAAARAHIKAVKGTPDAAQDVKPDADANADWAVEAAKLLQTLKG